jgi:hypothetical protein
VATKRKIEETESTISALKAGRYPPGTRAFNVAFETPFLETTEISIKGKYGMAVNGSVYKHDLEFRGNARDAKELLYREFTISNKQIDLQLTMAKLESLKLAAKFSVFEKTIMAAHSAQKSN